MYFDDRDESSVSVKIPLESSTQTLEFKEKLMNFRPTQSYLSHIFGPSQKKRKTMRKVSKSCFSKLFRIISGDFFMSYSPVLPKKPASSSSGWTKFYRGSFQVNFTQVSGVGEKRWVERPVTSVTSLVSSHLWQIWTPRTLWIPSLRDLSAAVQLRHQARPCEHPDHSDDRNWKQKVGKGV